MKFFDLVKWILVIYVVYFTLVFLYDYFLKWKFKKTAGDGGFTVVTPESYDSEAIDYRDYIPGNDKTSDTLTFEQEMQLELESGKDSGGTFSKKKN
ncbi:MAG: hypothetical protein LBI82_05630 [Dysgonamonadaceae bacterium]|jgi:hypothetical protein|nr:hypothetical protein [Dysgonamonadaceae bacterium]